MLPDTVVDTATAPITAAAQTRSAIVSRTDDPYSCCSSFAFALANSSSVRLPCSCIVASFDSSSIALPEAAFWTACKPGIRLIGVGLGTPMTELDRELESVTLGGAENVVAGWDEEALREEI